MQTAVHHIVFSHTTSLRQGDAPHLRREDLNSDPLKGAMLPLCFTLSKNGGSTQPVVGIRFLRVQQTPWRTQGHGMYNVRPIDHGLSGRPIRNEGDTAHINLETCWVFASPRYHARLDNPRSSRDDHPDRLRINLPKKGRGLGRRISRYYAGVGRRI